MTSCAPISTCELQSRVHCRRGAVSKELPRPARDRVLDAIEDLGEDPRPHEAKKLVGEQTAWRIRIGDYRVIYDVCDLELTVSVVRAAHRREVYDR